MTSKFKKRCDFTQHKSTWNRLFFSTAYPRMDWPRAEVEQFWLFLQKYENNSLNNSHEHRKKRRELSAKAMDKYSNTIPDEWKNVDFLKRKVKELHYQDLIDSHAIHEFRDVLMLFLDFNQNRKIKKVEKLKSFQQNLPIFQHKRNILDTIKSYSVILIAGDTGCGKSTQVPQYLLQAGYENISCTQPRRLACISLKNRLSVETFDEYGSQIGYQIRFEKHKTKHTRILFLTEGLLLRQMIEDPSLSNYNVIILDEIHERHLSCDFLLGAIKCLLNRRRDDLKVILMSATVNCELFSAYFGNCPVIKVPGRLYPIKLEYFPIEKLSMLKTTSKINPEPYLKLLRHIDDTYSETERGDALIFLSGYLEIETVGEVLKTYAEQTGKWIILYLHSSLSIAEQDKVFDIAPDGMRKCILSTNIAETSLTIDGVRFVIDSGKVKEMYYEAKLRMQKLLEIWVSKASAEQRKGRAGRTGPGVCFRLYSAKEFESFLDFSTPEIKRVSLASLLLNMISMGLNDVRQFPFLQAPELTSIESTLKSLIDYGTLDENEQITLMGRILSKLPVDICIGKMLIMAIGHNLVDFFLSAAACLSIQSLFSNRSQNDIEALEERKHLNSLEGDLFSYINFYSRWLLLRSEGSNTRHWCRRLALEEQRFFEVTKLRNQFRQIITDTGLMPKITQERNLSKYERMLKHGERKLYRKLKEDNAKSKKRKLLSTTEDQQGEEDEHEASEVNIKDVEFKLIFDSTHLTDIERRHRLTGQDIQIAKLIVCMSFYPQLAFADADNSYRSECEQMFHTKDKPFVVLHPTSVFYNQPEMLRPLEVEYTELGLLSSSHTLLGYISFIETSKTYICNCYPISALHAMLLCAREIDTNEDMSRIVCDDWIELRCASWEESQDILLKAFQIRQLWARLLESLFNGIASSTNEDSALEAEEESSNQKKTQLDYKEEMAALKQQMNQYLSIRTKYAMKRLLPADLKHLHTQISMNETELTQYENHKPVKWLLKESHKPVFNHKKGGLRIWNLNVNCLRLSQTDEMIKASRKIYECELCLQRMHLSTIEWARHEELCRKKNEEKSSDSTGHSVMAQTSSAGHSAQNLYFCPDCKAEFEFSKIDILRHKQKHL